MFETNLPEGFKPITLQAILDAAREHFIVNNEPPAADLKGCHYLTPDGRKCAVGLLIPDGHEAQGIQKCMYTLVLKFPELFDPELKPTKDLNDFQGQLHDNLTKHDWDSNTAVWENTPQERDVLYADTAIRYGLTYNRVFDSKGNRIPEEVSKP